jgi:hypothetical protein
MYIHGLSSATPSPHERAVPVVSAPPKKSMTFHTNSVSAVAKRNSPFMGVYTFATVPPMDVWLSWHEHDSLRQWQRNVILYVS